MAGYEFDVPSLQSKAESLPKNVVDFIKSASAAYGAHKVDTFSLRLLERLNSDDCGDSPIEQLFDTALLLQMEILYHVHSLEDSSEFDWEAQYEIGKYRVDFLLTHKKVDEERKLIVELDGHDFHDKDKKQRSYEKARDRFFIKSGYRVIHFTGSDVVADPHQVVFESLSVLGVHGYDAKNIDAIDPTDLLQRYGRAKPWLERAI